LPGRLGRSRRREAYFVNHVHPSWAAAIEFAHKRRYGCIAVLAVSGILLHLALRFGAIVATGVEQWPLWIVLAAGGIPLTLELFVKLLRGQFGSDLLAGISIVTSVLLEEYLAGALVVLMLSGGEALEAYAVRNASKALEALARRMPSVAHRRQDGSVVDVALSEVRVGDEVVVFPHEVCPVDGAVVSGHSTMDESYLTGEPYVLSKTPGALVLSGAVNGNGALTVRADKLPIDSRYAKIVAVMRQSEQERPRMRRLGDQLGAYYTPAAVVIALVSWSVSGEAVRFLAVLVVATPCPLLIAIPVTIIGAISLAARRGIIIKDPAALEQISHCDTAIFDKTGTLTYGKPRLVGVHPADGFDSNEVLRLAASLERYSKHPLSSAILEAANEKELSLVEAASISEEPGHGLRGSVAGHNVVITGRKGISEFDESIAAQLPPSQGGLECMVVIDGRYAGLLMFRDEPRSDGVSFIAHLRPKHHFRRVMLVSGDRESEVRYLADRVGVKEVYASQSPEQKLEIVRRENERGKTVFLGDGINDAPALTAATVGLAFGQNSDVAAEAADAVIMDSSLQKIDEFMHIGERMRRIALQSAVGGMALSIVGMILAGLGYMPPVAGAIVQEVIDVAAVLNALRMALLPKSLIDF
jgi:heavy metal translocating P-type ATPase